MQKEKLKSRYYNIASNVGIFLLFFFTLFSFGNVARAEVVYVQQSDNSGEITSNSAIVTIGTFTTSETLDFTDASIEVTIKNNSGFCHGSGVHYFQVQNVDEANAFYMGWFGLEDNAWGGSDNQFHTVVIDYNQDATGGSFTLPAGNYRVRYHAQCFGGGTNYFIKSNGAMDQFYGVIADSNGVPPPDFTSRIDTFTYATSTQTVNLTGYWNATSTPNIQEELEFWQESTALGQESYVKVVATTTGAFNFTFPYKILPTPGGSTTTAPILETIYFKARLSQINNNYYDPFGSGGLDTSLYRTILDTANATLTELTHDLDLPIGLLEYPEYECAITSITGCLKNAGIWLFYPSSQKIEQFKSLSTDLQSKFPFAYAYGINQMRQELFSASTTPQTISLTFKIIPGHGTSTLELISQSKLSAVPYANTVKTILGWILWLLAIEYIYYRVIRSHDPNTPA